MVTIHITNETDAPVDQEWLASIAGAVLEVEGYPSPTEVHLLLVSDDDIAAQNREFLGREGPTDVLSFPLESLTPGQPPAPASDGPPLYLGDVVIAPDHVRRQAEELEVDFESELALMVVHGVLHMMGYDHESDSEAAAMEAIESKVLSGVGLERRR